MVMNRHFAGGLRIITEVFVAIAKWHFYPKAGLTEAITKFSVLLSVTSVVDISVGQDDSMSGQGWSARRRLPSVA